MNIETRNAITALVRAGVVPAIGCTEPACVALAVARAKEILASAPSAPRVEHVHLRLSANIIKNAMGVGIPGTGMVGLPIATALGVLVGRSAYGLEVLRDATPEAVAEGKTFIAEGRITTELAADAPSPLYVEAHVYSAEREHEAVAVIAEEHTRFVRLALDGEECTMHNAQCTMHNAQCTMHNAQSVPKENSSLLTPHSTLNFSLVWEYSTTSPLDEISFIAEARRLNLAAAALSLQGNYGHTLGKVLSRPLGRGIMGDSIFSHILSSTSCACDARMAGAMIPVMSNSGSGNQGICATNPVCVFAEENHNTEEETLRALMLSHLTAIYIKQHLGALSALCGCVVASTGAAVGITFLMGGGYKEATFAVKNMIANLTGMICDGAKPSCALKLTSGVSTAVLSAMLAMQGNCVSAQEGIIDDDVDRCIFNLTHLGAEAMRETDRCVLDIMVNK